MSNKEEALKLALADNARLVRAIEKTIDDNGHLADGDNCTLIELVNAIKAQPEKQFKAVSDHRLMEQQGPVQFDVWIDDDKAKMLWDMLGEDREDLSDLRLLAGPGHSGYGLYVALAEVSSAKPLKLTTVETLPIAALKPAASA